MFNKLSSVLRAPLVPLYSNYTEPALQLAASILKRLLTELSKQKPGHGTENDADVRAGREKTANSLLSGIIVSDPFSSAQRAFDSADLC